MEQSVYKNLKYTRGHGLATSIVVLLYGQLVNDYSGFPTITFRWSIPHSVRLLMMVLSVRPWSVS